MQIVIDIPMDAYNDLMEYGYRNLGSFDCGNILKAVTKGTILPKEHGDLIDKGKFRKWIETQDGDRIMTEYYLDALEMQEKIVGGSDGDIDQIR